MATDAKRTVVIDIQVQNNIDSSLKDITKKFNDFAQGIEKAKQVIETIGGSLSKIKISQSVINTIETLKGLNGVSIPSIDSFVASLEKLSGIGKNSNLDKILTQLNKWTGVVLPDLTPFAKTLEKLTTSLTAIQPQLDTLKILRTEINKIKPVSVDLSGLAKGIGSLAGAAGKIKDPSAFASIGYLGIALKPLVGMKIPNVQSLFKGMEGIKAFSDTSGKLEQNIKELASSLRILSGIKLPGIMAFVKGLEALQKADIGVVTAKLFQLAKAIERMDRTGSLRAFATFASDINILTQQLAKVDPLLSKVQNTISGVGKTLSKAGESGKGFGERLTNYMQYRVIADSIMAMKEAFVKSITAIKDFDQALADLKAITGATDSEMSVMKDTIIDVAGKTKFSAIEISEGMKILGQAGFTAAESIQAIGPISNLATGTLSTMAETVDVVSTALRVFDISASKTAYVVDILAMAINKSKLDIDKLRTAFNYIGPIASEAGISIEEASSAMMVLANAGLRASTIGTGLRRLFSDLIDPPEKFAAAIEKAGFSVGDFDPKVNGLQTVLSRLNVVITDAGQAFDIFGKWGASAVIQLKDFSNGYTDMLAVVGQSGAAAKMASVQVQGLGVMFKNLMDKVEILGLAIGDSGLTGFLKGLVNIARVVVDTFTMLVNSGLGGFIFNIGLAAIGVSTFVVVLGKLSEAYAAVRWVMLANLHTGMAVVASQAELGAIVTAVGNTFAGLGGKVSTASTAIWKFITAASTLQALPLIAMLTATAAVFTYVIRSLDDFKESSDEASKSAVKFNLIQNGMTEYNKNIAILKVGTDEYANANKNLQKELYKVANENMALSASALAAAESISPLTGEIKLGSTALAEYNEELNKVTLAKFASAYTDAMKNVKEQTSGAGVAWGKFTSAMSTTASGVGTAFKGMFNKALSADEIKALENRAQSIDLGRAVANKMKEGLHAGTVSWDEFRNYVNKSMAEGLIDDIPEQKSLVEMFSHAEEKAGAFLKTLRETKAVNADMSVENFEAIAKGAGAATADMRALISQFTEWKRLTDKSSQNPMFKEMTEDFADGKSKIQEFYDKYREYDKDFTGAKLAKVDSIEKSIIDLVKRRNEIEKEFADKRDKTTGELSQEDEIKRLQAQEKFNKEFQELNFEAAKNEDRARIVKIQRAQEAYEKQIKQNENYLKKGQALNTANAKAQIELDKQIEAAMVTPFDAKALKEKYQTDVKEAKKAHEDKLHQITLTDSDDIENHKRVEAEKLQATLEYHKDVVAASKALKDKMDSAAGADQTKKSDAEQLLLEAQAQELKFKRDNLEAVRKLEIQDRKERYNDAITESKEKFQTASKNARLQSELEMHNAAMIAAQSTEISAEAERKKFDSILRAYDTELAAAREHKKEIDDIVNANAGKDYDPKAKADAMQKLTELEQKKTEFLRKELESRKKEEVEAEEHIKDLKEKYTAEEIHNTKTTTNAYTKYVESKSEAEDAFYKKINEIENKRIKKVRDINREILNIEKETQQNIDDIHADAEDKKRAIWQRGKSDQVIENDNRNVAWSKFDQGSALLESGAKNNDIAALNRAKDILKKAQDMGAALKNGNDANRLIDVTDELLQKTERAIGEYKKGEKVRERNEANAEAQRDTNQAVVDTRDKLSDIKNTYLNILKDEKIRHDNTMSNLDAENAKYQKRLEMARELIELSGIGLGVKSTEQKPAEQKPTQTVQESSGVAIFKDKDGKMKAWTPSPASEQKQTEFPSSSNKNIPDNGGGTAYFKDKNGRVWTWAPGSSKSEATTTSTTEIKTEEKKPVEPPKEEVKPEVKIEIPPKAAKELSDTRIEALRTETPEADITQLKTDVSELTTTEQVITFALEAETVDEFLARIDAFKIEPFTITPEVQNMEVIDALNTKLDEIDGKSASTSVEVEGSEKVSALKELLDAVVALNPIKTLIEMVGIPEALSALAQISQAISEIPQVKYIDVITRYSTEGSGEGTPAVQVSTGGLIGMIQKFATGGSTTFKRLSNRLITSGSGTKDDVPALLMKDEFVHRQAAVKKYGTGFMNAVNSLRFPKALAQQFEHGGLVSNFSDKIVQTFSKGGAVLGLAKKKLEEFFGLSSVNVNLGSVAINNEINKTAESITTPIGTEAINKISDNFESLVAAYASGGSVTTKTVLSASDLEAVKKNYDSQIALAARNGQSEIAKILTKERDEILNLSDTLDETLRQLEEEYRKKAELKDKIARGEISEQDASYLEKKEQDEKDYNKSIEDAKRSDAEADLSYFQSKEERLIAFNEKSEELKKSIGDKQEKFQEELAEKQKTIDELKQKDRDYRDSVSTYYAYKKGSDELYNAPIRDVLEQFHRSAWSEWNSKRDSTGKGFIMAPTKTTLGEINKDKVEKSFAAYTDDYAIPLRKANSEYNEYAKGSPKSEVDNQLKELKIELDKSTAEAETSRAQQLAERALSAMSRDKDYVQKRAEADYEYEIAKKEEAAKAQADGTKEASQYVKEVDHAKGKYADVVALIRSNTARKINSVKDNVALNVTAISDSVSSASDKGKSGNLSIEELLRRLGSGILRFNTGGLVPMIQGAVRGADSILAALTPKEYVMNERAVATFGSGFFDMLNALKIPQFNSGGLVSKAGTSLGSQMDKVVHALDLTVNGNYQGQVHGDAMTIESFIDSLNSARMRS